LLVLNKGKYVECFNILKEMEKFYSEDLLYKNPRYITAKAAVLLRSKSDEELE